MRKESVAFIIQERTYPILLKPKSDCFSQSWSLSHGHLSLLGRVLANQRGQWTHIEAHLGRLVLLLIARNKRHVPGRLSQADSGLFLNTDLLALLQLFFELHFAEFKRGRYLLGVSLRLRESVPTPWMHVYRLV